MKILINWSGEASHAVAKAFREWIPSVINAVEPWVSGENIATGAHWPTDIHQGLDEAKFGMICITPDNLSKPCLLLEAGALSKHSISHKYGYVPIRLCEAGFKAVGVIPIS
jgi:hypothetical protein